MDLKESNKKLIIGVALVILISLITLRIVFYQNYRFKTPALKSPVNFAPSEDVPELIKTASGEFYLYNYQEPKKKMYCIEELEDCDIEPVYGDYSTGGYDCEDSPFYNSRLSPPPWEALPISSTTTIKINNYVFLTDDSNATVFLLKDDKGACHPYKFRLNIFNQDQYKELNNRVRFYSLLSRNKNLANKFYSPFGYWCGGSKLRILADSQKVKPYLKELGKISKNTIIYTIDKGRKYEDFQDLNFLRFFSSKEKAGMGYNIQALDSNDANKIFEEIKDNLGVLFLKTEFFPEKFFVFPEINFMYFPGC